MGKKHEESRERFVIFVQYLTYFVFFCIFVYGVYDYLGIDDKENFSDLGVIEINQVLVKGADGSTQMVDLPQKLKYQEFYSYDFRSDWEEKGENLYLFIQASYLSFVIKDGEEIIYEYEPVDTDIIKSGGSFLRLIKIPEEKYNKTLTISFSPTFKSFYGVKVPVIKLGSHSDLMMFSYYRDFDVFMVAVLLFVFGIVSVLLVFFLLFFKRGHFRTFLVFLFCMSISIYILISSPIGYLTVPRGIFLYTVEYSSFMILPISLVLFMMCILREKNMESLQYRILEWMAYIMIANLTAQTFFVFMGWSEYMRLQRITQFLIVISLLLMTGVLFTNRIKNKDDKLFMFFTIMVNTIFLVDLVIYFFTSHIDNLFLIGLSAVLFVIFQFVLEMRLYAEIYEGYYVANLYKNLALIDNLTRLANRNSFDNDFSNLQDKVGRSLLFMFIDINNIKVINDTYGHNAGDYVIRSMADIINEILKKHHELNAYRIGGDEFVLSAFDVDEDYAEALRNLINELGIEFCEKKSGLYFSFGVGYGVCQITENFNVLEYLSTVDKKMYEDKRQKKEDEKCLV